ALVLGTALFLKIVLVPISFGGAAGVLLAGAVATAMVAALTGLAVRLGAARTGEVDSGIAVLVRPLTLGDGLPPLAWSIWLLTLAGVAGWLALTTAEMDWNYMLQKLTVLLIWLLMFASFYAIAGRRTRARRELPAAFLLVAILPVAGYRAL